MSTSDAAIEAEIRAELAGELNAIASPDGTVIREPFTPEMIDALVPVMREGRKAVESQRAADQIDATLRAEYLAIMRECREGTATAARVRRGLYLVMRLAARTYYTVNE